MLVERNTYKPTGTPQARSNFGSGLKDPRGRVGVQGLKTSSNHPDEALTPVFSGAQDSREPVPAVFVLSQKSSPLMPTTPRKARVLLTGIKVNEDVQARDCRLLESSNSWLASYQEQRFLPTPKGGGPCAEE